jgi:Flp pilus assembly protein TadG
MHRIRCLLGIKSQTPQRGQSMVEFALILPIFLLMLFGLVDMGRLVYANTALSQAARESTRLAAVQASWVGSTDAACNQAGGPVCPANEAELRANVLVAANRMMTAVGTIAVGDLHIGCTTETASTPSGAWTSPPLSCATAANRVPGSNVSARIAMDFDPITPLLGQIFSSLSLSGSATMTIH